jgi:cell division ATPase FtsA
MNATVPEGVRLLNLAMADIGAGTTDIAICRDGSVIGYTMVTEAGDEISEAIMRGLLVDFQTAERIKRDLGLEDPISYRNILGVEETITAEAVHELIHDSAQHLADAIRDEILSLNGGLPAAVFLAGGGSRLQGLREMVAKSLGIEDGLVAIAGSNFSASAVSDTVELNNPELATPLGIAVSAGLGLLNDSYLVQLNGQSAKLFRSGVLTVRDVLLMNGYGYNDMIGKTGKRLTYVLNGRRVSVPGDGPVPATLHVNGEEAALTRVVRAGDRIRFQPALSGADAHRTLGQVVGEDFQGTATVNGKKVSLSTAIRKGDEIVTRERPVQQTAPVVQEPSKPAAQELPEPVVTYEPAVVREPVYEEPVETLQETEEEPEIMESFAQAEETDVEEPQVSRPATLHVTLNESSLTLEARENGRPYYLMDLLQYSGLDFDHLDSPVRLEVNGIEASFRYELKDNDNVAICCEPVPRHGTGRK